MCWLQTIAALPAADIPFEGIKVAIKGRMSGKGGMTSRKVWTWGRTSTSTLSDPVDYAHEAVITRAGYIGIKASRAAGRVRGAGCSRWRGAGAGVAKGAACTRGAWTACSARRRFLAPVASLCG